MKSEAYLYCEDVDIPVGNTHTETVMNIANHLRIAERAQETFLCVCWADDIYFSEIGRGMAHNLSCTIRECLQMAVLCNAKGIATLHNHPASIAKPSSADKEQRDRLKSVLDEMGIEYCADVVLSFNGSYCNTLEVVE